MDHVCPRNNTLSYSLLLFGPNTTLRKTIWSTYPLGEDTSKPITLHKAAATEILHLAKPMHMSTIGLSLKPYVHVMSHWMGSATGSSLG